jgi:hypothetical protein
MYDVGQLTTGGEQPPGLMRLLLAAFAQSQFRDVRRVTGLRVGEEIPRAAWPWRQGLITRIAVTSVARSRRRPEIQA